ncbi:hypothetical protein [Sandarakinorhabdus rubra]|uniref:hypothetical protein n=1 Tax=Sandarakinorhabdus rubra TaxID=2672568 RepID=UPI0013DA4BEA|nr:hypothetical protein [Sandarakinorhabdus rubra]
MRARFAMRFVLALLGLVATQASATEVIRLSDAARAAVLDAAANGPERSPVLTPEAVPQVSLLDRPLYDDAADDRRIHGEVTMFAGSGGTFGMAGTAVMPLGNSGMAAISLMRGTGQWGGLSGFGFGYASDGGLGTGSWNGRGGWNGLGGLGLNPLAYDLYGPPRRFRR